MIAKNHPHPLKHFVVYVGQIGLFILTSSHHLHLVYNLDK